MLVSDRLSGSLRLIVLVSNGSRLLMLSARLRLTLAWSPLRNSSEVLEGIRESRSFREGAGTALCLGMPLPMVPKLSLILDSISLLLESFFCAFCSILINFHRIAYRLL